MCKTAGTVEAWNFILKRVDNCDRHMRPDVFIHQHYEAITAKATEKESEGNILHISFLVMFLANSIKLI